MTSFASRSYTTWVVAGLLAAALLLTAPPAVLAQTVGPILYVNASATGAKTGSSWQDAFDRLEDALDTAYFANGSVTQIWVAAGTYKPDGGSGNRIATFFLVDGVAVYGGFAGNETALTQRNPSVNVTTLSGDIGIPGVNTDNSYNVVVASGLTPTAVLDGFTIRDGNAGNNTSYLEGGGILIEEGSSTIRNCRFVANSASYGGGLWCSGPAVISGCTFENNTALVLGGGIYVEQASQVLGCRLIGNSAQKGGGVYADASSTVSRCTIEGNTAAQGAGVYTMYSTVSNCRIAGNTAVQVLATTLSYGGGIYAERGNTIANCIVAGNTVTRLSGIGHGGGIACEASGVSIRNCTIVANNPAGVSTIRSASPPNISNSILWGNAGGAITREAPTNGAPTPICYSDYDLIEGSGTGAGNISVAPGLSSVTYRLLAGSPCINAGDPAYVPVPGETDVDGQPRVSGGRIDMGADEIGKLGDANGDGKVNVYDLQILGAVWNTAIGSAAYDSRVDFNQDGKVNIYDLQILAGAWNT